jgi:RNA polymerase sigma factor (sigma-70 family)
MSARLRLPLRLPELLADDRALLARYVEGEDHSAFAALVKRYGALVLGVCRRAVRDHHLAEDAFQAVFLTLARNPDAASRCSSIGGWLFGVARRVGLAARRNERRRANRERKAEPSAFSREESGTDLDDLLRVVDEELAALPDIYRDPLITCYLREQTQDEAARQLGWSLATLRRRLDRGKALLRARLTRRGVALSAGLLANGLTPSLASAVPPELIDAVCMISQGTATPSPVVTSLATAAVGKNLAMKVITAFAVVALGGVAAAVSSGTPPVPPPPPVATSAIGVVAPAPKVEWVTLTGRVVFPGTRDVPKPALVELAMRDRDFCLSRGPVLYEDLLIDPKTRGIQNAVVWLRRDAEDRKAPFPKEKIHPKLAAEKPRLHTVTVNCCQYEPRVIAARAGDTLAFKNAAKVPHNVMYNGSTTSNWSFNVLMPVGGTFATRQPLPILPLPDSFRCSFHPWMKGYVWAFDHPYSTVTDSNGRFTIPKAPVGTWRLVVWHERVGYRNYKLKPLGQLVEITDRNDSLDVGNLTFEADWDKAQKAP